VKEAQTRRARTKRPPPPQLRKLRHVNFRVSCD